MDKIDFINAQKPAINDTNLNQMQLNIERAINAQVSGDTLPIGSILPYASDNIPENWLLADGSEVSRTEYDALFSIIGTIYGEGDGSTTFNLPNLCGKVIIGQDESDDDFNEIGKTLGEKEHTLSIDEMPSHRHSIPIDSYVNSDSQTNVITGGHISNILQTTNYNTNNTGSSQPHNNIQPSIIQNYIIKTKQTAGIVATVIDNLASTSVTNVLSANQGRILNEKIDILKNQKNYSTEEIDTGEIWVNGKTIYQKTIIITSLTSDNKYSHGISNFHELISIQGSAYFENTKWQPLQRICTDALEEYSLGLGDIKSDEFLMQLGTYYSTFVKAYVTIKYTKTV